MGWNTWVPTVALENWISASTVVIEDGKGALQKNTGDRDSRIQTVLDSSSEHPLVARTADRVWAAALPSVTDLSANSSKLAGSHPHSVLLYFSI